MKYVVIDWLEVFVDLPDGFTVDSFSEAGCHVEMRDYGTRIYNVMATVHDSELNGGFEVRCSPKSSAVLAVSAAHIKVLNKDCYMQDPAYFLWRVICKYNMTYKSISRVDICTDFVKFDSGIEPTSFIKRVLAGVYRRNRKAVRRDVVQDSWDNCTPNYIAYQGRDVTVRMYDKTLELVQVATPQKRAYIGALWVREGFIRNIGDLFDSNVPHVFRLEFQISSSSKDWVLDGTGHYLESSIDTLCSQSETLLLFSSLMKSYFEFFVYKKKQDSSSCQVVRLMDCTKDVPRIRPITSLEAHRASVRLELMEIAGKLDSWSQRHSFGDLRGSFATLSKEVLDAAFSRSDLTAEEIRDMRLRIREPELFAIG